MQKQQWTTTHWQKMYMHDRKRYYNMEVVPKHEFHYHLSPGFLWILKLILPLQYEDLELLLSESGMRPLWFRKPLHVCVLESCELLRYFTAELETHTLGVGTPFYGANAWAWLFKFPGIPPLIHWHTYVTPHSSHMLHHMSQLKSHPCALWNYTTGYHPQLININFFIVSFSRNSVWNMDALTLTDTQPVMGES